MGKEIIIFVIIAIVGIGAIITLTSSESDVIVVDDVLDKDVKPVVENSPEIQEKLDEIEQINLENEYSPKVREWIESGPFQIDRSEYILGEKIFLRIGGLEYEEKGQAVFLKPKNSTHYEVYMAIPFDGADKPAFNYYLEPDLSALRGICTAEDLIGDWRVVFRGTDYPNLEFKIIGDILPGDEENYQPVC